VTRTAAVPRDPWMSKLIRFLLRRRAIVLPLLLVSVALAGWSATQIRVRFQYRDFYDYPGNPDMPLFARYNQEFGDPAGFVIVLVEADDVFRRDVLAYVGSVTRALQPEAIFSHVRSLTNAKVVRGDGDDVVAGLLMPQLPDTPAQTELLRRVATHSTLLLRRLISADSKATVVLAEMRSPATLASIDEQREAIHTVQRVLAEHPVPAGVRVRVTGGPTAEVETTRSLSRDLLVFTPAAVLLIILALSYTFRSVQGVVLPLVAVSVALVWTAGIFALFHHPVDIVGSTMPATLLVYGVVDPIFVLTRFNQKLELGRPLNQAILEAELELRLPCFLTSLTTALGFAAFATASLPTVADFGKTVAIGVALSWVTTVVVLPPVLSLLPPPRVRVSTLGSSAWLDRRLQGLWGAMRGRSGRVLVGAAALMSLLGVVGARQHISSIYVGNLPKGPVLDAIHVLEAKLSGVIRTVVYFEGEPDTMKRPDVLEAIAAVDRFAEQQPMVNTSVSLADLVADENEAFNGGDPKARVIPKSRALVAQYLALLDPDDRSDFVDAAYAKTHLRILTDDPGSEAFRDLRVELERVIAAQHFDQLGVRVSLTGTAMVGYAALDRIVVEMLWGFVYAFLIIVLAEAVMFRSLRIALISIAPNLLPVLASFVWLRLFHISLRMDTSLFLSVSVGGLFNTTIHFAARVRQRVLREGASDPDAVIEHAMRAVGPPALYTAAILSLGFASFLLSGFPGLRAFGMLAMVTLMVGFFSDMVITASSLRAFFGWKQATPAVVSPPAPPEAV
jgi:predicted RND superfamily exporter protein